MERMPIADRPWMPGYGTLPADEGRGLLAWEWAIGQLERSHDFWLATTWPDGRAHVMPVWGVWWRDGLWFSAGLRSRKARNLARDPRCTLATDDARNPLVLDGTTERVVDLELRQGFIDATNAKYDTSYSVDFLDPAVNGTFRFTPSRAIGMLESDFEGSPTRWRAPG